MWHNIQQPAAGDTHYIEALQSHQQLMCREAASLAYKLGYGVRLCARTACRECHSARRVVSYLQDLLQRRQKFGRLSSLAACCEQADVVCGGGAPAAGDRVGQSLHDIQEMLEQLHELCGALATC